MFPLPYTLAYTVLSDEDLDADPPGHKSGYVAVIGKVRVWHTRVCVWGGRRNEMGVLTLPGYMPACGEILLLVLNRSCNSH